MLVGALFLLCAYFDVVATFGVVYALLQLDIASIDRECNINNVRRPNTKTLKKPFANLTLPVLNVHNWKLHRGDCILDHHP